MDVVVAEAATTAEAAGVGSPPLSRARSADSRQTISANTPMTTASVPTAVNAYSGMLDGAGGAWRRMYGTGPAGVITNRGCFGSLESSTGTKPSGGAPGPGGAPRGGPGAGPCGGGWGVAVAGPAEGMGGGVLAAPGRAACIRPDLRGGAVRFGEDDARLRLGEDGWRARSGDDGTRPRSGDDRARPRSGDERARPRSGDDGTRPAVEGDPSRLGSGNARRRSGDEFARACTPGDDGGPAEPPGTGGRPRSAEDVRRGRDAEAGGPGTCGLKRSVGSASSAGCGASFGAGGRGGVRTALAAGSTRGWTPGSVSSAGSPSGLGTLAASFGMGMSIWVAPSRSAGCGAPPG